MVFGVQKGGFYNAKVWFLQCESRHFVYVVVPWRVTSVRVSTIFWYLHIRIHPQNGGGKRIFDNARIRAQ